MINNVNNSISFKGIGLVHGQYADFAELDKILEAVSEKSEDKNGMKPFKFISSPHDDDVDLFVTGEHAEKFEAFMNAREAHMKKNNLTSVWAAPEKIRLAIIRFNEENLSKYIKIPKKTIEAKDILKAIEKKLFDFENFKIIKGK